MYRRRNKRFEGLPDSTTQAPAAKEPESNVLPEGSRADGKYSGLSSDPEFSKKAGLDSEKKEEITVIPNFKPSDLLVVIDLYAIILSFAFSQILKTKFDVVHDICKFDADQRQVVAEFAVPVVTKYFPQDWIAYLPEIKLTLCLVGITTAKFQQCHEKVKAMTIETTAKTL